MYVCICCEHINSLLQILLYKMADVIKKGLLEVKKKGRFGVSESLSVSVICKGSVVMGLCTWDSVVTMC